MKHKITVGQLAGTCCLSLMIAWQTMAASQIEQPGTVNPKAAVLAQVTEQDAAVTPAGCCDGGCSCSGSSSGCNSGCCKSCCEPVCCPKKVTEEVKKHCWNVKPEMICIPGFRFECNWRKSKCCKGKDCCGDSCCGDTCCSSASKCCDCGTPTCGRVRCINVLEKHEYTCEECGYEWEVKCVRTSKGCCPCGNGCCPSCGASGCCASNDTADADVQLTSAEETSVKGEAEEKEPSLASRLMWWLK